MIFTMNVITAWISVFLAASLAVVYLLRIVNKGHKKHLLISKINKKLRNIHKPMGIAFVIVACIHGYLSSGTILSLNFGTACIAMGILLGLTYWLRKVYRSKLAWVKPHRWLTVVLIVFLGLHLWEVGGIMGPEAFFTGASTQIQRDLETFSGNQTTEQPIEVANVAPSNTDTTVIDSVVSNTNFFLGTVELANGNYTGVGTGYAPDLTVSVTVLDNKITDIQIISHNENNVKYYGKAIDAIPTAIIANQTPIVDSVSGATYTSTGIKQAVLDALSQAVIRGTLPSL